MDFINRQREYSGPGDLVHLSATFGPDNESFILCVARGRQSSLSTSSEGLKADDVTVCEDKIVIWWEESDMLKMILISRNVPLSWESINHFIRLIRRLKLCERMTNAQRAVHRDHIREAQIIWFLALIDACSWVQPLNELPGHINNMSTGNFLLLRNSLPLRHLKLGDISSVTHLNKQTKPKSVPMLHEQYLYQAAKMGWLAQTGRHKPTIHSTTVKDDRGATVTQEEAQRL